MRRENHIRIQLFRRKRINVGSIAFYRHFPDLIAKPAEFPKKKLPNCSFIAGDRFNVNQLSRQRDRIHGTRIPNAVLCVLRGIASRASRIRSVDPGSFNPGSNRKEREGA